jgi:hypothetical protein
LYPPLEPGLKPYSDKSYSQYHAMTVYTYKI